LINSNLFTFGFSQSRPPLFLIFLSHPLFIKKHNDEGGEFYYMGDVTPQDNSFEQTSMRDDNGKEVSVVKMLLTLKQPVETHMYEYLTTNPHFPSSFVP
jgi:hypothetical protein